MEISNEVLVVNSRRAKGEYEGRPFSFTNLTVVEPMQGTDSNQRGLKVTEIRGAYELFDSVSVVPAIYDLNINWDGKKATVSNAKFKEEYIIEL